MSRYIVQLEPGLWINGDTEHTNVVENAEEFHSMASAVTALTNARKSSPYPRAEIEDLDGVFF